jgi:circadian clock protein KaiB
MEGAIHEMSTPIPAAKEAEPARYVLRLCVAGMPPRSIEAIRCVTVFCEKHLGGRYDLETVDIYQKPASAKGEQIVAVRTFVKRLPTPLRRFIGAMHDENKLMGGMDLPANDARTSRREEGRRIVSA